MKLAVVLTDANQADKVEIAAAAWRSLYPNAVIIHATNTASIKAPSADVLVDADSPNPGYYAPEGVLHGHHANLNAGVREALKFEGWDYLITTCGDIKPVEPRLLIERYLEVKSSSEDIGVCYAPWGRAELENWTTLRAVERYQDDVLIQGRSSARYHFPIRMIDTKPRWSEVAFFEHCLSFASACIHTERTTAWIEDLSYGWYRKRWYEKWGFEAI